MTPYEIIGEQMDFLYEQGRKIAKMDKNPVEGQRMSHKGIPKVDHDYQLLEDKENEKS